MGSLILFIVFGMMLISSIRVYKTNKIHRRSKAEETDEREREREARRIYSEDLSVHVW